MKFDIFIEFHFFSTELIEYWCRRQVVLKNWNVMNKLIQLYSCKLEAFPVNVLHSHILYKIAYFIHYNRFELQFFSKINFAVTCIDIVYIYVCLIFHKIPFETYTWLSNVLSYVSLCSQNLVLWKLEIVILIENKLIKPK